MSRAVQLFIPILSILILTPFISFAQATCGDIIFYEEEEGENYEEILVEMRTPIEDCNNPFNADIPDPFTYTLQLNGEGVSEGEVVVLPTSVPVTGTFTIDNPPNVDVSNFAWPQFVLYQATGTDYKEVVKAEFDQNFTADNLETGDYTAVFMFLEPPVLTQSCAWWQCPLRFLFGTEALAFYPNYIYVATLSFSIEHEPVPPTGASSVLFLPGIKASRLYLDENGETNQLWNPNNDSDVLKLRMDSVGATINDVYTEDIIESVGIFNFYKDFISELETLKDEEIIRDFTPFAYDWRYSVFDVASQDVAYPNGEYKNLRAEVERLAAESHTGKVTLIGHSNGGLVAKALLHIYGEEDLAGKVDKIIMIGTPQLGTPLSIGSLLHGYEEALGFGLITTTAATREAVHNMPGAYGLLPSSKYFEVTDNETVVSADDSVLAGFVRSYGDVTDESNLATFLTDSLDVFPVVESINDPLILNKDLLDDTLVNQVILDNWVLPEGVEVYEVVGTGLVTIKGFEYRSFSCAFVSCPGGYYLKPYPLSTNYGDGVVVGNSAEGFDGDKTTFYINLFEDAGLSPFPNKHANLTESDSIQEFVISAIKYPYLTDTLVSGEFSSIQSRYTIIGGHSPVTLRAATDKGRVGIFDNEILQEVPGSKYFTLGDSTYLVLPSDEEYEMEIIGTGNGVFTLTIDQLTEDDTTEVLSYLASATTTSTMVSTFTLNNREISNLSIDYENDGIIDLVQTPQGDIVVQEPPSPTIYTYDDLNEVIKDLEIKRGLKKLLLIQVRLAEKFSKRDNRIFQRLEKRTLETMLKVLKKYNKRNFISDDEYSNVDLIIKSLSK